MSRTMSYPMRVRFAECDPQGIVFNSRYLEYFDVAMTEIWREALGPYDAATADAGVDLVVAEAGIRYLDSLRFDDEFVLQATVRRIGTSSMTTAIVVLRDGTAVAEGELHHVFLGREDGRPTPIPKPVRAAFEPYLDAETDPAVG
ncbi:MAG: acyl-CoA thioesterase [Solirubrobacterales bacterium]|nr:acyl-CoA thioesterase [Solirubrobacterales bacterium]